MSSILCCALLCLSLSTWQCHARQQSAESIQETLPNLEISLAPPHHPWPQVAAELGALEHNRESVENANMVALQKEFNKALIDARTRIGELIARLVMVLDDSAIASMLARPASTISFRQLPQHTMAGSLASVKINVIPESPPDPSLKAAIDDVEHRRDDLEKHMFDMALGELKGLTNFILSELEVQIQGQVDGIIGSKHRLLELAHPAFLEQRTSKLPAQFNIRAVPVDTNYPTITSMVQDMETRRDIAEDLARAQIVEKQLDFISACNRAAEDGLKSAVSRILAMHPLTGASH